LERSDLAGEVNLNILLRSLKPLLREGEYVFCTIDAHDNSYWELNPVGIFKEDEGITLILSRDRAEAASLSYTSVFAMITLSVHSSLEAVGFISAIAAKLAARGISVNPVSAYYHDHLFVPVTRVTETMAILQAFALHE
jgi:uncharacterized protein